ncbi:ent-kaurenoic acid oxidase 2-like [Tripterygium wilfordii]|uniref:ent-kaurenoic acid oxidase 2-like n=1 Tax=Tripterygium wilfordii TaxID=458696 RepID=UPI0018F816EB|nr:ent-kaurenoic acid oxidase 2-like [Tripterygium wilfordii]
MESSSNTTIGVCMTWILVGLPVLVWLLWWWNELWYVMPLMLRRSSGGRAKLPPGNMGFPFFGEMLTFLWYFKILGKPDEFIDSKRRKYGDGAGMYRTHLFGSPSIIACFPSINKFVLNADDLFLREWPNIDLMGRNSLLIVHGKAHSRLRSYVLNALNRPKTLRHMAQEVQPKMVAALQSWSQKDKVIASDEIKKVTFENIGRLFVSMEPGPLLDFINKLCQGIVKGIRAQPLHLPGTASHYGTKCRRKLDEIFMEELKKKKEQINGAEKTNDLMDGLMEIKDEEGNQLSDIEVVHNIVSLIVAGYESTSLATMWAVYCLAKYPNVLQKLREENMAMKKNNPEDLITREDVSKLEYTNKVVKESIRMANVTSFVFRSVAKEVEFEGYRIPKDWKVILWFRYLHTNSEYFDDPMCFNPDRWDEPAKAGTYLVFGQGPRLCPGNSLARISIAVFLHHLSIGYKWELVNPDAGMTYLPHPKPVDGVKIAISKI